MVETPYDTSEPGRLALGQTLLQLRRDSGLYAVIGAYVLVAALVSSVLGRPYLMAYVQTYGSIWIQVANCLVAVIACQIGWTLAAERPQRPLRRAWEVLWEFCPSRLMTGMALFLATFVFMGAFTTLKTVLPSINAFWADQDLGSIDRTLHFGHDPWRLLHPILGHPTVTRFVEFLYGPVWSALVTTLVAWMCLFCRDPALRTRFLLVFLMGWILNGTLLAGLFMSAGPVFEGDVTGQSSRFSDLITYLQNASNGPFSAVAEQRVLWTAYTSGDQGFGAGISAFPSLHVTMATLVMLAGWSIHRLTGAALTAFCLMILLGSVHLGWHYAVDGYASLALTLAYWWLAGRWVQRTEVAVV